MGTVVVLFLLLLPVTVMLVELLGFVILFPCVVVLVLFSEFDAIIISLVTVCTGFCIHGC